MNDSVGLVGLGGKNTENLNKSLLVFPIELFVGRISHTKAVFLFSFEGQLGFMLCCDAKVESQFSRLTGKKRLHGKIDVV